MRTTAGRDWQSKIMGDTASNGSGAYAPAVWVALSAEGAAPAASDTSLPGEIASGSLVRAQAAFAHTTGAATYTLTRTFTSDQSVTITKYAIFTASSGGTMVWVAALPSPRSLTPGDSFQIIHTVSL